MGMFWGFRISLTLCALCSGWRISLAGAGVPALMLTLGAIFLPDTPNSLLDRGFASDAEARSPA